jgi:hypothetical protein
MDGTDQRETVANLAEHLDKEPTTRIMLREIGIGH